MPLLVLASHNAGKVAELRHMLEPLGWQVTGVGELGLIAPEETGVTFEENALLKAKFVRVAAGVPTGAYVLADDSGLCVDALEGAPGVDTANYGGFVRLLAEMSDILDRQATFWCVLALLAPDGTETLVKGRVTGRIAPEAHGTGGFDYDPVFIADLSDNKTFAEMDKAEKAKLGHRGAALRQLLPLLEEISG